MAKSTKNLYYYNKRNTMNHILIGSDHGGFKLKQGIIDYLSTKKNITVNDVGTHNTDSVDYPDIANSLCTQLQKNNTYLGILCCGTGIGISIRANRFKGIRAALVYDQFTANMAKAHNNANILCFGGRTTLLEDAIDYIDIWLETAFEGDRHLRRLDKLDL